MSDAFWQLNHENTLILLHLVQHLHDHTIGDIVVPKVIFGYLFMCSDQLNKTGGYLLL